MDDLFDPAEMSSVLIAQHDHENGFIGLYEISDPHSPWIVEDARGEITEHRHFQSASDHFTRISGKRVDECFTDAGRITYGWQ